ncbi:MAG: 4-(cytidine 5'-diphospho)-2-C-methyl-D-erythritol kinase, partial [Dehalococcoidia bacterium]
MRLTAPAKINWTLEVLARRDDGYHEVRTVLQTIDLCDELRLEPADTLSLTVQGRHPPTEQDLTLAAARLLA